MAGGSYSVDAVGNAKLTRRHLFGQRPVQLRAVGVLAYRFSHRRAFPFFRLSGTPGFSLSRSSSVHAAHVP